MYESELTDSTVTVSRKLDFQWYAVNDLSMTADIEIVRKLKININVVDRFHELEIEYNQSLNLSHCRYFELFLEKI